MDRRELLKTLTAAGIGVTQTEVLSLPADDTLCVVFTVPEYTAMEAIDNLKKTWGRLDLGVPALVLCNGATVSVMRKSDAETLGKGS